MNRVFMKAKIGNITLNNRIVRSATHEGMADDKGNPTELLTRKYLALARGEAGAIITGYAGIQQNGKSPLRNMLMIDSDEHIAAYGIMVRAVHQYNTPVILQIAHCGRQTSAAITGLPTVAPSPIRDKLYREAVPQQLSDSDIADLINSFVRCIERAQKAGFDGVQLHLAHGYLLSSFLSPHMNKRTDKWGGSTENRFRIVQEIMGLAGKRAAGYPLLAKINAYENSRDGIKIAEAVKIARLLEQSGCAAIEVSGGILEEGFVTTRGDIPYDMLFKHHEGLKKVPRLLHPLIKPALKLYMPNPKPHFLYHLEQAKEIKRHVNIPVSVVGGIRKIKDIKTIIEQGSCDFVSMSRPFIIEPNIVKKFKDGQSESKCINCNFCLIGTEVHPLKCYYGKV